MLCWFRIAVTFQSVRDRCDYGRSLLPPVCDCAVYKLWTLSKSNSLLFFVCFEFFSLLISTLKMYQTFASDRQGYIDRTDRKQEVNKGTWSKLTEG